MIYNDFSSRVVIPRVPAVVRPDVPPKAPAKKGRRVLSPRIARAVTAAAFMFALASSSVWSAESTNPPSAGVRVIPAPHTVPFKSAVASPLLDDSSDEAQDASDLAGHLGTFSARVSTFAANSIQVVKPAVPAGLSLMTKVLLCCGLGVAMAQLRLLFRDDLSC